MKSFAALHPAGTAAMREEQDADGVEYKLMERFFIDLTSLEVWLVMERLGEM